ncbi:MAG: hypothetical protein NTY89_19310 [Nostocales cyanobacterium LacPavin_0920_SED1_MAG_38_18]|nr:hypothetical protein [Nostocales cyanobacterium LacPavin_0920_SED1_MAG_38_18]
MTSFAAWVGVDSRGMTSFYFASDSRISWWGTQAKWDRGRKLFASRTYPDIFGYCGDVLFPSLALSQAIQLVDDGLLFEFDEKPSTKFEKLCTLIQDSFNLFPKQARHPFDIAYCSRIGIGLGSTFELYKLSWTANQGWIHSRYSIPTQSELVLSLGTGKNYVEESNLEWKKTAVGGTSRAIFSAFCDSLQSKRDPLSGGVPQLVGIHRQGSAKTFGIIYDNETYVLGLPVKNFAGLEAIEWFNPLFERCDPHTMQILPKAQRQPRPKM